MRWDSTLGLVAGKVVSSVLSCGQENLLGDELCHGSDPFGAVLGGPTQWAANEVGVDRVPTTEQEPSKTTDGPLGFAGQDHDLREQYQRLRKGHKCQQPTGSRDQLSREKAL